MSFTYIFERLFDFEKMFRELAADLQLGRATWFDVIRRLAEAWDIVRDIEREVRELEEKDLEPEERAVVEQVKKLLDNVKEVLGELGRERLTCMRAGLSPRDCHVNYFSIYKLENTVMEFTGSPCAFKVSTTFTSKLNDLSACVHRFAEVGSAEFGKWTLVDVGADRPKCYVAPRANEKLVDFCIRWSRNVDILYRNALYAEDDYERLKAWVIGDRAYLRVGSVQGHATEIDLEKGELKYYDQDRDVINILEEKLREAGLNCEKTDFGLRCVNVTPDKLPEIARILPFATSMDLRLKEEYYYLIPMYKYLEDYVKELKKRGVEVR